MNIVEYKNYCTEYRYNLLKLLYGVVYVFLINFFYGNLLLTIYFVIASVRGNQKFVAPSRETPRIIDTAQITLSIKKLSRIGLLTIISDSSLTRENKFLRVQKSLLCYDFIPISKTSQCFMVYKLIHNRP